MKSLSWTTLFDLIDFSARTSVYLTIGLIFFKRNPGRNATIDHSSVIPPPLPSLSFLTDSMLTTFWEKQADKINFTKKENLISHTMLQSIILRLSPPLPNLSFLTDSMLTTFWEKQADQINFTKKESLISHINCLYCLKEI